MRFELAPVVGDFGEIPQPLSSPKEEPRWCPECGGEQAFHIVETCDVGRIGFCLGCEARKMIPFLPEERLLWYFERTNGEAA